MFVAITREEDIRWEFLIKSYLNYDILNENSLFLPSKSKWLIAYKRLRLCGKWLAINREISFNWPTYCSFVMVTTLS